MLEFSARVKGGEDHFHRALLRLRVAVDRNTPAIIHNGDGRTVYVQRHLDVLSVPVHRLVDRVVDDLPHEVVKTGRADAADVHPRPFTDRLEALENGDIFRGVRASSHV